ncbi:MAG: response regulator [Myxococcales bacterium]|nr:response regulator [Myxococcales bacterium]MCB9703251.1 response regulator [Myxococcales bacterium]
MSDEAVILVIEDEVPMRRFLRALVAGHGLRVVEAASGEEGIALAASHAPDVILLDLGLPGVDGLEVTRRIREWSETPIIVISARGLEEDKVRALDLGADDYLTKPFGASELLARLRVALRHAGRRAAEGADPRFVLGDLEVDLAARVVRVRGEEVHLTPIEYRLLALLVRHAGRVLTHRHFLREIWGPGASGQDHYVRVHMSQLRRKIEEDPAQPRYVITETGVGYRLRTDA